MAEKIETFEIPNYSDCFLKVCNEMRTEGILQDVDVKIGDQKFKVHKDFLAVWSVKFRQTFSKHKDLTEITITGVEPTILKTIIEFIYSGKIEIKERSAFDLWVTLNRLEIQCSMFDIRTKCALFINERLKEQINAGQRNKSFAEALEIRFEAQKMGTNFLVSTVEKFIGRYLNEFMIEDEYLALEANQLLELIGSDHLFAENEEIIFEAGMLWIKYNEEERINFLIELFGKIRLNLLSKSFLIVRVCEERFIQESQECMSLLSPRFEGVDDGPSRSRDFDQSGKIFVIGGTSNEKTMEVYNPVEEEWCEPEMIPTKRNDMGMAVMDGKIYILGGRLNENSEHVSTVEIYDPMTKVWSQSGKMIVARSNPAVTVERNLEYVRCDNSVKLYNKTERNFAFVCGGSDHNGVLSSAEYYHQNLDTWFSISPMLNERTAACAVALNGFIYVMGGYDKFEAPLNKVERYNPSVGQWEEVKPMLNKRVSFGAAVLDKKIYVCGGDDGEETLSSVEVYDPNQNEWQQIEAMNTKRTSLTVVSNIGKIWAIGGISELNISDDNDYEALDTVETYDPDEKIWKFESQMSFLRDSHVSGVVPFM